MDFTFTNTADTVNNILMIRMSGFATSMEEYLEWEQDLLNTWREHFGNERVKVLSDQRGFRPTSLKILERVFHLRRRLKLQTIANAVIVDSVALQMQLRHLSQKSGFEHIDEFFTDPEEGLQWLTCRE